MEPANHSCPSPLHFGILEKIDSSSLGPYAQKVQHALKERAIESPFLERSKDHDPQESLQKIQYHLSEILKTLHLNLTHPDLAPTPGRVAKMYLNEIFSGLDYRLFPEPTFSAWENLSSESAPALISVDTVEFTSHCMHHLSMMQGKARMSYFPKKKILGLSKVHRIFKFFSARPQLQELFTMQCLVAFQTILETEDVIVAVCATHGCVRSRGIRDSESWTKTIQCGGRFLKDSHAQMRFLNRDWQ